MADIVPFGKYRNQPIATLAQDRSYCDWLLSQGWVAERYPELHTLIINNFGEPSETPEHNRLQLRFLDQQFLLKTTALIASFYQPDHKKFKPDTYKLFLHECLKPRFEVNGIDVLWHFSVWAPSWIENGPWYHRDYLKEHIWVSLPYAISVECKPSLGDDYPAVLRFMHSLNINKSTNGLPCYKAVIVDSFTFQGGSIDQVCKLFEMSGVSLFSVEDIETLPHIDCFLKEDLPSIEDYRPNA